LFSAEKITGSGLSKPALLVALHPFADYFAEMRLEIAFKTGCRDERFRLGYFRQEWPQHFLARFRSAAYRLNRERYLRGNCKRGACPRKKTAIVTGAEQGIGAGLVDGSTSKGNAQLVTAILGLSLKVLTR
jgi:hypothetical protein